MEKVIWLALCLGELVVQGMMSLECILVFQLPELGLMNKWRKPVKNKLHWNALKDMKNIVTIKIEIYDAQS